MRRATTLLFVLVPILIVPEHGVITSGKTLQCRLQHTQRSHQGLLQTALSERYHVFGPIANVNVLPVRRSCDGHVLS